MSEEETGRIRLEIEEGVATITLNRPAKLNAFAGSMRDDLREALERAGDDPETRVLVITGAGRAFSAGADIRVMEDLLQRDAVDEFAALVDAGIATIHTLAALPFPTVAAVNGAAAGAGASLALACDMRFASQRASLGVTFGRIGLHPDWGATWFLPRLVGPGRARELVYSARMVKAEEALRIGLFERVVPAADFDAARADFARSLAAAAPLAIREAKRSLSYDDGLEAALEREREAQLRCFRSADVREGIAAFRERREPAFAGR
ncbi:MAG: enoyl-CoA hydratase/isomerase family protein [Longimicrobiaceae bacterium]